MQEFGAFPKHQLVLAKVVDMPRYTHVLALLLIVIAAYALLPAAGAKPEDNTNGNPKGTGTAKSKKDRDDALDSMNQGKPNVGAAGTTKDGTSKRAKFARTINALSDNLG
jgi:hypothetical protein